MEENSEKETNDSDSLRSNQVVNSVDGDPNTAAIPSEEIQPARPTEVDENSGGLQIYEAMFGNGSGSRSVSSESVGPPPSIETPVTVTSNDQIVTNDLTSFLAELSQDSAFDTIQFYLFPEEEEEEEYITPAVSLSNLNMGSSNSNNSSAESQNGELKRHSLPDLPKSKDDGIKKKTQRCPVCKKKLTFMEIEEFQCHCGKSFCSAHRNAEAHSCSFDYKKEGKRVLAENNPVIVASKIRKI